MHRSISADNIRYFFWAELLGGMNFLQPVLTLFYLRSGLDSRDIFIILFCLNVTLVFIPVGAVFKNFDQSFLKNAGIPVGLISVLYAIAALLGFFASHAIGWLTERFPGIFLMRLTGFLSVAGLLLAA